MSEVPIEEQTPAPMNLEIELPATRSALLSCLETIGDFGAAASVPPDLVARARIVVEELYSNTIKYGYGGECDRRVALPLSTGAAFTVIYEDDARSSMRPRGTAPALPRRSPCGKAKPASPCCSA